jgi:putative ABC transport system substrate-binding protein
LRAGGLVIGSDPFFTSRSQQLAELTVRHSVPAIYQGVRSGRRPDELRWKSYDFLSCRWQLAGRILRGEKPADLPVQQTTTVELIVNLKTAKSLGITVPLSPLGRADEVIE